MLAAMAEEPNGLENLKLLYGADGGDPLNSLGALTPGANPSGFVTSAPAAKRSTPGAGADLARAIGEAIKSTGEGIASVIRKPPKEKGWSPGPTDGGGGGRQGTDWTTYALVGGGVLLAGAAVFMIVRKMRKGKK